MSMKKYVLCAVLFLIHITYACYHEKEEAKLLKYINEKMIEKWDKLKKSVVIVKDKQNNADQSEKKNALEAIAEEENS